MLYLVDIYDCCHQKIDHMKAGHIDRKENWDWYNKLCKSICCAGEAIVDKYEKLKRSYQEVHDLATLIETHLKEFKELFQLAVADLEAFMDIERDTKPVPIVVSPEVDAFLAEHDFIKFENSWFLEKASPELTKKIDITENEKFMVHVFRDYIYVYLIGDTQKKEFKSKGFVRSHDKYSFINGCAYEMKLKLGTTVSDLKSIFNSIEVVYTT